MREALWKGSLSFGLVDIPVSLRSAETRRELEFSMVDRRDLSPIGYRKVNKRTGAEVPGDQVAKAYRHDGDYVVVTEEDFRRASPERSRTIRIEAFVNANEIDPAFFERPYFVEPMPRAEKAYALLREALRRTGKAGVATVVISTREHLCALFARGPALMLELLRFGHELRSSEELRIPDEPRKARLSEAEVRLAERLVEDMAAPWRPEAYKDRYHDELLDFLQRKAEAGRAPAPPPPPRPRRSGPPADILALLRESVAQAEASRSRPPRGRYLH